MMEMLKIALANVYSLASHEKSQYMCLQQQVMHEIDLSPSIAALMFSGQTMAIIVRNIKFRKGLFLTATLDYSY